MTQRADDLITSLADRLGSHRSPSASPRLIAVDGRSGVGKSTFAERLARRLDAALISGDDFYAGGTDLRSDAPEELADACIDRARLGSVLQQLKVNRSARYAPFDWEAFDGAAAKRERVIHPREILVLEGVYSNHPDLREFIDLSVLLRLPEPERQRRLLAREGEITQWERQWHRAEAWYFQHLAQPEDFDVVASAC